MSIFSKPIVQISSAVFVAAVSVLSLCSDGDWDWVGGYSSFAPEAYVQDKSYEKLFYTTNMFYGETGYDDAHSGRFSNTVATDWKHYLNGKISDKQLDFLILNDSADTEAKEVFNAITRKKENKWSRKYDLKNDKVKNFFVFLNLAKTIETYANTRLSWNYDEGGYGQQERMATGQAKKIEAVYDAAKDPFLKNRYWFQAMKAHFYSDNKSNAILFFNKTQATLDRNELYYRGLSYVAGALYKAKDYSRSNFLYSIVFDNCPQLRTVATYCFHPQQQADFNQSLDLAKTNQQKAALWALYGYYADEVSAIENIYALDAKNPHLDYLLSRAINIAESKMNSSDWNYGYGSKINTDKSRLNDKLYQIISKAATEKKVNNLYLWQIAVGYLEVIKSNHTAASNYFNQAEKNIPNTELAKDQLHLFKVFNEVASVKKIDAAAENKLLPHLEWLFSLEKSNGYTSSLRYNFLTSWTKNYLSLLYKNKKEDVLSELFYRQKDFYLNPKRVKDMEAFFTKSQKSDWEKLAMSLYTVTLDDIYEFKAIQHTYNNEIDQAIVQLEKTMKAKNDTLPGNPFNGNIKDCNDCDHVAYQKTKFTKLSFLKKIQEMQKSLASGTDNYNNSLLLGNAFYNLSHYGNARAFYGNKIVDQYGNDIEEHYQPMLMNNQLSGVYYQKAFENAKNDEQKAKMTYLLSKIERNEFYKTSQFKPDEVDFTAWNGFKKLKKEYSKTKYYQEVIEECGYFKKYLGN
ncbi:hypothetical protein [Flavobacterium humi]|uniref:Uncharacterized protein n=1 Tax=Flavobacterium humi TaxID=2562683 RepID=A0A4Z0L488_9FLAO|nr:hypothetical protein [Flavobacterium humi]TGD57067.1 hypothetical protein E4635_12930 [Flavobacterium humi]